MTYEKIAEVHEAGGDIYQLTEDVAGAFSDSGYKLVQDRETQTMEVWYEVKE